MNVQEEVRDLLRRGFVTTAFQPIVQLNTGRVVGYESLLRGPAGSPLANPGYIFGPTSPLSSSLIMDLDAACIAAALRAGRLLVPFGQLFINLHISTLVHMRQMQDHFQKLMESSGIPPEAVVIEISERSTTSTPRALSRVLRTLRKMGYQFALDDFGTAYSGLQHLLWFEPEFIKVDRAFCMGIHRSARKQALMASIASLSKKLGSDVIVEGVESTPELLTLMALDIPMAQGFHFGKPQGALFWTAETELNSVYKQWFRSSVDLEDQPAPPRIASPDKAVVPMPNPQSGAGS